MRKIYFLLITFVIAATSTFGQVTGTKTIGIDYPTLAAAITDLNTVGVGAGGATINVPGDYTETVPVGGLVLGSALLNASLGVANPLIIQKSGAGANPLLTAFAGGSSTTTDGIFKLLGTDYVTITSIDLRENPLNAAAALMEWGYALVNLNGSAPFDGCQNVTIQNSTVTMERTNPNASMGFYASHNTATSVTALVITAAGDLHSNNKIYGNTITNTTFPIFFLGYNAPSPYTLYDQNNDIGGSSPATGNTITNTGNMTGFNSFGIYLAYHNGANASYNNIAYFQGFGGTAIAYGIYFFGTTSTATANNNTITVGQSVGSGAVNGIYAQNTGSIVANNNTITFQDAGGTGAHYGIQTATAATANISNNTFSASNTGAVTGSYQFIYDASTGTGETFTNNTFSNINLNTTGTTYLIYASNSTPNVTATGNVTSGTVVRTGATGTFYGYYNFGSPGSGTANISNNNFSNITLSGSTAFYGIYQATGVGQIENVNNNTISAITAGTGTQIGIHHNYGAVGSTANGNTVSNITATGTVTGIQLGNATASLGLTVSNNIVHSLSTTGASTVSGIIHTTGANTSIFKNKIYNLQSNSATGIVNGITLSAGVSLNVYNNLIGDLRAPSTSSATDAVRGINITSTAATSTINVHYNTIYLAGSSSGANFGASGVFHTTSTTATTANLTLRNNIIYNNAFAKGTGFVTAFRRSSGAANTLNNYNAASNRNLFFAGAPSASQLIYYDGTSSAQTLAAYQAGVFTAGTIAPRDANSVTELSTPFLSTNGANVNFLHINPAIATVAEGNGGTIAGVTDDYDGDVRNVTTPDIGADEFNGTAVVLCNGTPVAGSISGSANICTGQFAVLDVTGFSANTGISLQWQSSAVSGGPYTPIIGAVGSSYNTGVIPTGTTVYYVVTVTCSNGGASATTAEFSVTSNAAPTVGVTPGAPAICTGGAGVVLTANGAVTYSWSPATGLSATTGAVVTANPTATTTYTVTGTNAFGCINTANVTVTVSQSPIVTTSATPSSICAGQNSQLNSTVNLGGIPYALSSLTGQTYTTLSGAGITIVNTAAQLTPGFSTGNQDDGGLLITLPFTFTYMGNTFTQMSMSTNGWVAAGSAMSTITAGPDRTPANLFTNALPNNTIAAWFKDMGANFPLGTGSMRHGLVGTDVYAFQWDKAIGSGFTDGSAILINFQVNIYGPGSATPGRIELIYGPTVGSITFGAAIGVENATGGTNNYLNALDGTGTSTTTSTVWPGNGNGYRFDPLVPTYSWSPSTYLNNTTIPNPLASNVQNTTTYTLTVTSTNGCITTSNVTVTVLSPDVSGALVQPTTCVSTDGSITLTVSGGGGGPYTFAWVGSGVNATSQDQTNLGVGSYTVTVTDQASGCTRIVTFNLPGPGGCDICPTIPTLNSTPPGPVCVGENVTLTTPGLTDMGVTYGIRYKYSATGLPLGDPYTEGISLTVVPNAGLTAGGTMSTYVTPTLGSVGTYHFYAILDPVPVDPTCRPFATYAVVTKPLPVATATPSSQTICSGTAITTIALSSSLPGTTYAWTRNNTVTVTGIAANGTGDISGSLTNTTSAPVTVTFTIIPTSNGCAGAPITATVLVNPTPVATATPSSQTICSGANITNIALSSPVAGTTYAWTRNNTVNVTGIGASGTGTPITGALTNTTTTPQTVTFTIIPTANGCPGAPITATVLVNPTPNAVATPSTQTVCTGTAITTIVMSGSVTGTTYAWTRNNTVSVTGIGASGTGNISGTLTNTTTVQQTVTFTIVPTANGCPGPSTTATVIVNPNSTITCPSNITAPSVVGACTAVVSYTPTVTGSPAPTLTYTFSGATTGSGAGSGSGSVFNVGVTTVTITATNICTVVNCSFTITVTDSQLPVISVQPQNRTSCVGSNVTFNVTATNALSYQWQLFSGGTWNNVAGATSSSLAVNGLTLSMNTNTYRVLVNGLCTQVISNPATVFVNSLPIVSITSSVAGPLLPGQTMDLIAIVSPGGGTFVWYKNGVIIPGATGSTLTGITVSDQGTYKVTYTAPTGCVNTSADFVVGPQVSNNLYVYPNPNRGVFQVRYYNLLNELVTVNVYDNKGGLVFKKALNTTLPYTVIDIDLGTARAAGSYVVEVRNAQGKLVGAKQIIVVN